MKTGHLDYIMCGLRNTTAEGNGTAAITFQGVLSESLSSQGGEVIEVNNLNNGR